MAEEVPPQGERRCSVCGIEDPEGGVHRYLVRLFPHGPAEARRRDLHLHLSSLIQPPGQNVAVFLCNLHQGAATYWEHLEYALQDPGLSNFQQTLIRALSIRDSERSESFGYSVGDFRRWLAFCGKYLRRVPGQPVHVQGFHYWNQMMFDFIHRPDGLGLTSHPCHVCEGRLNHTNDSSCYGCNRSTSRRTALQGAEESLGQPMRSVNEELRRERMRELLFPVARA
ncbi:hypothetical protein T439DRAFT_322253 [Meredithblackwellia eburnea MCA 4105]